MIPRSLRLRNFLSYGEDVEPLDFTSFSVACLSGRNGHGKSALLDAMTWAVWGEARKASHSRSADSDLLRLDADEMEVEFLFDLGGRECRIYRSHRRGKRSGKLEFSMKEPDGDFALMTGANKRETQKRIIDSVGLDYRTFINSSFLQQGKADEFTRQSPQDRKTILGNILGLGLYDKLLEETKQRLSQTKALLRSLEESLAAIETELEAEDELAEEAKRLNEDMSSLDKTLSSLRERERAERRAVLELNYKRERLKKIGDEQADIERRLEQSKGRRASLDAERSELEALIERGDEIRANKQRSEQIDDELKRLIEVEAQWQTLERSRRERERAIDHERSGLRERLAARQSERDQLNQAAEDAKALLDRSADIEAAYKRYQELQKQTESLASLRPRYGRLIEERGTHEAAIETERQNLARRIAQAKGQTSQVGALRRSIADLKAAAGEARRLETEAAAKNRREQEITEAGQEARSALDARHHEARRLETQRADTREKLQMLSREGDQDCPLCRQPLSEHAHNELKEHLKAEQAETDKAIAAAKAEIKRLETRVKTLRDEFKQAQAERKQAEAEAARLKASLDSLAGKEAELAEHDKTLVLIEQLEAQLASNEFAPEARSRIAELDREIESLGFDPKRHEELQRQLNETSQTRYDWQQLQDERKRGNERQSRIKKVNDDIKALNARLESDDFAHEHRKALADLTGQQAPLTQALAARQALQNEQHTLRNAFSEWNRLEQAGARLAAITNELDAAKADETELAGKRSELDNEQKTIVPLLASLPEREAALNQLEADIAGEESRRSGVQQRLGAVSEKRQRLEQRKTEQRDSLERRKSLSRELKLYDILRIAFSRNGIPAMIVERALPELENDANKLLRRLTQGTCAIAIESQRETQAGRAVETLDIKISDEMGTRDYELFSGGEAFRADLALRIALSQLLCRRAGSRLQLLVIDEGFGTQDAEGVQQIVDAIGDIQDEFEKILVVTHLEELKEQFMTRIEVNKEPGAGSRFQVIHTF